ncbi:discoidin domain-containing protein [Bacteroides ovatus]|uniref:F5/8 type C domain-containing protein n=1 Tax=Bacteroides ovatus TaxID=28116 RepID=A0A1G8CPT5_BACOV|nr:discoidin domain-containing protein [Bacteroides ovatus]SDH47426.1 F5/8 type C domain-containing protein [Bacteroides ovatus]
MKAKRLTVFALSVTLFMGMAFAAVDNKENNAPQSVATEIDRTEWEVSASNSANNQGPDRAVDEDIDSRWTLGKSQEPGDWFLVDMQTSQKFDIIELQQGKSANDFPRSYEIYISKDNKEWGEPIVKGKGMRGDATIIALPTTAEARFVKIVQTGNISTWWSIHELIIKKK